MGARPSLILYCQHSLRLGPLERSLALAGELAMSFRVILLSDGPLPIRLQPPQQVEIITLPPIGDASSGELGSHDEHYTSDQAHGLRQEMITTAFRDARPAVLIIEQFPFGGEEVRDDVLPLLEQATELGTHRPLILCSLRDILASQEKPYDERASALANRYFDGILVHVDPQFARLEQSFHSCTLLRIPIHYTGFVVARIASPGRSRARQHSGAMVVSAGGGLVGAPLLRTAIEAHALLWPIQARPLKVIAGPFCPQEHWRALQIAADGLPELQLFRQVPDLFAELQAAAVSVSQCGYNTALDLIRARVPALVVPYGDEENDEQMRRARRLEQLGAVRVLDPQRLDVPTLAAEMRALLSFRPQVLDLDVRGARTTARLVSGLARARHGS
jgi:predicted glycosyltransferase